ncbi:DsbA family protein [Falsiroseomonas oryziterrae]|uniref:DsbA family protein n=1 Tax=Falsiroseomonas oryziterrae TaxID=2911368 RepID=UPI001F2AC7F6|nr:DsbA family protein [Roseomonas sp. NPKOSM-4]
MTPRRSVLALAALALPGAALAQQAAPEADPRLAERSVGRPDAPVTVQEYFSLTCGHCAAFHRDTWPRVKRDLVDTGRVRMIWRDFPLDQTALMAAMVARALPPDRYEGFISTLFQTQDRWAFARNSDPRTELARMAALAGMSREAFDATITDQALGRGILEMRLAGQQQHNVNSTPTFVFGSRVVPGNMPFDRFAAIVAETR